MGPASNPSECYLGQSQVRRYSLQFEENCPCPVHRTKSELLWENGKFVRKIDTPYFQFFITSPAGSIAVHNFTSSPSFHKSLCTFHPILAQGLAPFSAGLPTSLFLFIFLQAAGAAPSFCIINWLQGRRCNKEKGYVLEAFAAWGLTKMIGFCKGPSF